MSIAAGTSQDRPLLSVVVPIYNVRDYLGECLDSLGRQRGDFEFLLVNDGSTDGSDDLARAFCEREPRARLIDKANSCYGASLNRGFREARGSYLGVFESDDVMYEGALSKLIDAALRFDADLVRGSYSMYWSSPRRDELVMPYDDDLVGHLVDTTSEGRVYLYHSAIWSGIYSRELVSRMGTPFLETAGAAYQDTSFMFKAFASSKCTVFIKDPIIHYRQDREGSSVRSKAKVDQVRVEFDEIDRWISSQGENRGNLGHYALVARLNACLWNLDRIAEEFQPDFVQTIADDLTRMDREGRIDWGSLDSWRALNARMIMKDPQAYLSLRRSTRGKSSISKVAFSLRLGGISGLGAALKERGER